MKICIIPICFNAHFDAQRLLDSINKAYAVVQNIDLEVILMDNSTSSPEITIDYSVLNYKYSEQKNKNIGYFPAFNKAIVGLKEKIFAFEYIIVCNVDLVVAEDFLQILKKHILHQNIGLIAPGIYSEKLGYDLNPGMMKRPSKIKIKFMMVICSNIKIFKMYMLLSKFKEFVRMQLVRNFHKKIILSGGVNKSNMYGAHGSFMIFTKNYFIKGANVDYKRFLFGEEGFVAEQLRNVNLIIEHVPTIRIYDKEHGSTSKVTSELICSEHRKSYKFYYENYMKDGL
jgi:GT2 family glycosyltransferase